MAPLGSVTEHTSEGEGGQEDVTCRLPPFLCPTPNQLLSTSHKAAHFWGKRAVSDAYVAINTEKLLDSYGKIKAPHQNNGLNQSRGTWGHTLHIFGAWSGTHGKRWGVRT